MCGSTRWAKEGRSVHVEFKIQAARLVQGPKLRYKYAMNIDSVEQLRALYPAPKERAVRKQLSALDVHCLRFIQLSPFVILASSSTEGAMDASPRGGAPGFGLVSGGRRRTR